MKVKFVLARFAILIGVGVGCIPLFHWLSTPELTEMQVFIKYWWTLLIMVPLVAWGLNTMFSPQEK